MYNIFIKKGTSIISVLELNEFSQVEYIPGYQHQIKKQYYQHLGSPLFERRTQEMLHHQGS